MRILVHIHTWNDAEIVATVLDAVGRQTRPVEDILLVDNGSTDGTAELAYPPCVTVIRHAANLGTSGAVKTGLEYALARSYDWLWVLDADSVPRPDALELLARFVEEDGQNLGAVCTSHNLLALGQMLRGRVLTPGGPRLPRLSRNHKTVECDSIIWSGALINVAVVGKVGLPRAGKTGCWEDLALDYGDIEYAYRINRAGYRIIVHCDSIIDHPVGRGLHGRILGWDFYSTNHPAFRRYLYFRNLVFFWLKLYHRRNWPLLLIWFGYRFGAIIAGIMLLERQRWAKIKACLLGIRDGLLGRLDRNFSERVPGEFPEGGVGREQVS
jgi:GT2 family glycosyltransferase